ncbi:MAG: hypothetical protein ABUL56_00375, partial [Actinomycetota bacterium]
MRTKLGKIAALGLAAIVAVGSLTLSATPDAAAQGAPASSDPTTTTTTTTTTTIPLAGVVGSTPTRGT